jgi:phosphodiesterase/alkaline phosphatase D-like protein
VVIEAPAASEFPSNGCQRSFVNAGIAFSFTRMTGYRLDVATNSSFVNYVPGYQNLDVGNVTSRNVTGLTANTTYYYRLRAYNDNGTSPNSNVIKVKTKPH